MNELIEIFTNIKKIIYKQNLQKYNMEDIFSKLSADKISESDMRFARSAYLYVSGMRSSLSAIGTKIILIERMLSSEKKVALEYEKFVSILKEIFVLVDNYIDGITAFSRLYQIKGQEYNFIKTIMELHAKRDIFIKIGMEYINKLIRDPTDSNELKFFLNDFLDTLLNEAYRLQINKMYRLLKAVLKPQITLEEVW